MLYPLPPLPYISPREVSHAPRAEHKMSEPSESRHASSNGIEAKDHVSVTWTKSGRLQARSKVGRRRQHIIPGSQLGVRETAPVSCGYETHSISHHWASAGLY